MGLFDKLQILFILFSAGLGLALGQIKWFSQNGDKFIVPFLMLMLTVVFLHVPFKDMRKAFSNFRFSGLSLGINFLWTPLFAWILGDIFLGGHPDLRVGFLMLLITPCTDWYLVFTQLAGGKTSQAAALLPWHLLLQLLLLPVYLLIFVGKLISIELGILVKSITLVLIIPFALSLLIRKLAYIFKSEDWFENKFLPFILPGQSIFLCFAIIAMFSSQGEAILANPKSTLLLVPPLLTFYLFNLIFSLNVCRIAKIEKSASVGFSFATLARNSPLALAIAVTAFPDKPLIALALVIGPLIELPTMGIIAHFFKVRFSS
ncbi:MAG: arsenic resistance protein [Halobacteriovoraceae bacterium]|nr:arsenic resistance protein [Halobacteriovoraceae bacterium]